MNTLSITSIKTMTYCTLAAANGYAFIERLRSVVGALLVFGSKITSVHRALALLIALTRRMRMRSTGLAYS